MADTSINPPINFADIQPEGIERVLHAALEREGSIADNRGVIGHINAFMLKDSEPEDAQLLVRIRRHDRAYGHGKEVEIVFDSEFAITSVKVYYT
jgi:hypothetical protein